MREWFGRLKRGDINSEDVPKLYEALRVADPLVNKAPFFSAKSYPGHTACRRQLWPLARVFPPARWAYRNLFTPAAGPPLVFKEVTFINPLRSLLERTSIPILYLVRHPCATVLSEVRGQGRERRPARQRRLHELLREHAPWLGQQFPHVVSGSDPVQRTALLWRCEVELCAALVRESSHGLLMTYEELAGDAYNNSARMFAHFGIAFTPQTKDYLDALHREERGRVKGPRRTGWGKAYFSVYRNPKSEVDSWKQRITADEQQKIEQIVQGSPVIEHLAALGKWW